MLGTIPQNGIRKFWDMAQWLTSRFIYYEDSWCNKTRNILLWVAPFSLRIRRSIGIEVTKPNHSLIISRYYFQLLVLIVEWFLPLSFKNILFRRTTSHYPRREFSTIHRLSQYIFASNINATSPWMLLSSQFPSLNHFFGMAIHRPSNAQPIVSWFHESFEFVTYGEQ